MFLLRSKSGKNEVIRNTYSDEFLESFYREAIKVAYSLKPKYWSLFNVITPEDLVQESMIKILRSSVRYDENKALGGFVRVVVQSVCIDLSRAVARKELCLSLDYQFDVNSSTDESLKSVYEMEIQNIFEKETFSMEEKVEVDDIVDRCCSDFNGADLKSILLYKQFGYSDTYTASKTGFRISNLKKFLNGICNILSNRLSDKERTLADILYGDEEYLNENLSKLKFMFRYVKDDETGVSLSDIIKLVAKGYSYRQIGKKLSVDSTDVKRFLDKCQEMVI